MEERMEKQMEEGMEAGIAERMDERGGEDGGDALGKRGEYRGRIEDSVAEKREARTEEKIGEERMERYVTRLRSGSWILGSFLPSHSPCNPYLAPIKSTPRISIIIYQALTHRFQALNLIHYQII